MKIGLWCPLEGLSSDSYSLTQVVADQARMLALAGHDVAVWVLQDWSLQQDPTARLLLEQYHERIQIVPILPRIRLYDYNDPARDPDDYASEDDPEPKLEQKANRIKECVGQHLIENDYLAVFTHDILFQNHYLPHGLACRDMASLFDVVRHKSPRCWIHWQHSASSMPPNPIPDWPYKSKYTGMKVSKFVYVNETPDERALVASQRGIPERDVHFVPNTRDICHYFGFDSVTEDFVRKNNLLDADLIITIPANMGDGKQPRKALMVLRAFREAKVDARLVWCASHTNEDRIKELKQFANELGLPEESFLITAEHCPEWARGAPRNSVRSLQQVSDILLLPSLSEAHSLIAMEAALTRQVIVVNHDFEAMEQWFPIGSVLRWHFGSSRRVTHYHREGEESEFEAELRYYGQEVRKLLYGLQYAETQRSFRFVRRERNYLAVYHKHYAPLLASTT